MALPVTISKVLEIRPPSIKGGATLPLDPNRVLSLLNSRPPSLFKKLVDRWWNYERDINRLLADDPILRREKDRVWRPNIVPTASGMHFCFEIFPGWSGIIPENQTQEDLKLQSAYLHFIGFLLHENCRLLKKCDHCPRYFFLKNFGDNTKRCGHGRCEKVGAVDRRRRYLTRQQDKYARIAAAALQNPGTAQEREEFALEAVNRAKRQDGQKEVKHRTIRSYQKRGLIPDAVELAQFEAGYGVHLSRFSSREDGKEE